MAKGLTKRQEEILDFVVGWVRDEGFPPRSRKSRPVSALPHPTPRAIMCWRSSARVSQAHWRKVAGALPRALSAERRGCRARGLPLVGVVPAGTPVLSEENFEGYVDLNELFGRGEGTFLLKVRGESMIGVGINDGDIVVVRHQERIDSGEIGVAFIAGEATVKRLFHEEGSWRLQPENPALDPIRVWDGDPEFRVAGKVIGVVRRF